jgi:TatD family-associated radical SAM protein
MKKAMTLTYEVGKNLYVNVTNRCPCSCTFCIRKNDDGAYGSDPLWLEHEPDMNEMIAALSCRNLQSYHEIVFCGYGEPLMRLHFVCTLAAYIRQNEPDVKLRLNTNGLADIYNAEEASVGGTNASDKVAAVFDKVSISLNGGSAEVYERVTRPSGDKGAQAYETMLSFAEGCRKKGCEVLFTVVDVISDEEIAQAKAVADKLRIPLEVRDYIR